MVNGEVHAANAAPSTRHWNVAPASEVKVNVGVASLVGDAIGVSVVCGAVPSNSYAPASHAAPCGRATPRWSTVRAPHAAMLTAELPAPIASAGGCEVSSAAASCGSVWTPPSPHWSVLSAVTLPPSSIAADARLQFAGTVVGPPPRLIVLRLPVTIEPWKRAVVPPA